MSNARAGGQRGSPIAGADKAARTSLVLRLFLHDGHRRMSEGRVTGAWIAPRASRTYSIRGAANGAGRLFAACVDWVAALGMWSVMRGRLDPLVAAAGMRLDEPGRKEV